MQNNTQTPLSRMRSFLNRKVVVPSWVVVCLMLGYVAVIIGLFVNNHPVVGAVLAVMECYRVRVNRRRIAREGFSAFWMRERTIRVRPLIVPAAILAVLILLQAFGISW